MVSVDVKHHVYLLTYQHYGSEKSRDLHMSHRKPRNGHIPDWKTNEPQTKTNEPQNMSSNIYDFFILFFSFFSRFKFSYAENLGVQNTPKSYE